MIPEWSVYPRCPDRATTLFDIFLVVFRAVIDSVFCSFTILTSPLSFCGVKEGFEKTLEEFANTLWGTLGFLPWPRECPGFQVGKLQSSLNPESSPGAGALEESHRWLLPLAGAMRWQGPWFPAVGFKDNG